MWQSERKCVPHLPPCMVVAPRSPRRCEKITIWPTSIQTSYFIGSCNLYYLLFSGIGEGDFFGAKLPSTLLEGGVGGWRRCFSRLVKIIIRILQPFLCFFFHQDLFIYLLNLLDFYPVTRFLVTPLLVTRYFVTLFSNTP